MKFYTKNEMVPESIRIFKVKESGVCPEHKHEFIELIYISEGTAVQRIDGIDYPVEHGDLLFVSCEQVHSFIPEHELTYVNILLEPAFLSEELIDSDSILELFNHSMFSEFGPSSAVSGQCVRFLGKELLEMDHLVAMMEAEYLQKKAGYRSLLHGCVRILITMLLRRLRGDLPDHPVFDIMPDILSYIDENCNGRLSLEEIAARSFYNPSYFGKLLKQYCGKSFTAYLKERRMEKASELLRSTGAPVEAVMNRVGYNDRKLFYRHFRELYGTSPAKFRKKPAQPVSDSSACQENTI